MFDSGYQESGPQDVGQHRGQHGGAERESRLEAFRDQRRRKVDPQLWT